VALTATGLGETSRRDRKKDETRLRLHQAALDLVSAHGLSAVTVEDITEAADVAPRTFFNYYSSKEQAVVGHDPCRAERLVAAVAAAPEGQSPLDLARSAILADLAQVDHSPGELGRMVAVVKSEPNLALVWLGTMSTLRQALAGALARRMGVPEDDLYPALVAAMCVAVTQLSFHRWCGGQGQQPITSIATEMFDCLAAGLQPMSGGGHQT
jgi:AcrR family transcriptional regulator